MTFEDLNLDKAILKALKEEGFLEPTPIQAKATPKILAGFDILASAQTGTGKTAAYILPILHRLCSPSPYPVKSGPRVLVLAPTRELAMQVASECTKFSRYLTRVKTVCIYGGAAYPPQIRELSRPYEILVATPGRLIDHLERGRVNLSRCEVLILDEADRMLDMGFIRPVEAIAAETPEVRQTLLFSATLKGNVLKLAKNLLHNPMEIRVAAEKAKHENIEQRLHLVDGLSHKRRVLNHLLSDPEMVQAIIFTSTKRYADELTDDLEGRGFSAAALHGDMDQRARSRTLSQLREGGIRILVATDVASRGIDVQTISHVINFNLPMNVEDYVHRIGRTGRAGKTGVALSLAAPADMGTIRQIEKFTGQKITQHTIPGLEPVFKQGSVPTERQGRSRFKPRFSRSR